MNQNTPYAVALQVVGIVVILAGIVDPVGESLSPVGAWLVPTGSLLVAGGAVAYANPDVIGSVFEDGAGMGDGSPDEDSETGLFENAAYRVGSSGGDAWTWSFEVQDRILAIGTIQYPSRDAAVGAVKRFRRAGEDVPITDADEEISEFTGKLLEQAPAGDEVGGDEAPRRYYVVHENGEWKVRLESGAVIESLGSDRNGAIRRARELGRRNDRSVMVNYKDGRLGAAYFDETEL